MLELGSGRGGLSRFVARELIKEDKLDLLVAANIAEEENNYNRQKALEENINSEKFRVDHASFDNLKYENDSFDIIFSNEAILHSSNKEKLMTEVVRILRNDGICVISDIIEAPNVDKTQLVEVYNRLGLTSMGNHELYDKVLTE